MIVRTPMRDKSRGSYHDTIFGSCPRRSCRSGLSSTMTLPPLAMASRANACDDRRTDRLEWRAISAEESRWAIVPGSAWRKYPRPMARPLGRLHEHAWVRLGALLRAHQVRRGPVSMWNAPLP